MKQTKNIVMLSITIVVLVGLVAAATYSYFAASVSVGNKITTNVKMPLRCSVSLSSAQTLALTVGRNNVLSSTVNNSVSVSKSLTVTVSGEPGTVFKYNVVYTHGSTVYSPTSGSGYDIGYKVNSETEANYNALASAASKVTTLLSNQTITIPSGKTNATATQKFTLTFYNRNWDQSNLSGKTYTGTVAIQSVSCA